MTSFPKTLTDALTSNTKFYYTGRPCKRGHIANRYTHGGSCVECVEHRSKNRTKEQRNQIVAGRRLRRSRMTSERYNDLIAKQEGKCAICGNTPKTRGLHADHCHKTGKPGLLLCARCNVALSYIEHPLRPFWEKYLQEYR